MSAAKRVRMLVTKVRIWVTQELTQEVMLARMREKKACREEKGAKWHLHFHFHNHTQSRIHSQEHR
jgi:hypothetical protein